MIRLLPLRLAVSCPSRLTSGRSDSTADAASMAFKGMASVTKPLPEPDSPGWVAAFSAGATLKLPPAAGTTTSPLALSVDRNSSK